MEGSQRARSVHRSPKEGKLLFRTPNLQLFLSQKVSHLDEVFDDLLFKPGPKFVDLRVLRTNRLNLCGRAGEEFPKFQTF